MSGHDQNQSLRDANTHFAFGKNWASFSEIINPAIVDQAKTGLHKLFPEGELNGAEFLDIGCGSGLSMLAAKELGAATVHGVDIDVDSVRTATKVLGSFLPTGGWTVREESVFNLDPEKHGRYGIVHSWGVLHHTGDMWPAIEKAAAMVKPGGLFALALYRKTPFCDFWTWEKRVYTNVPPFVSAIMRGIYKMLYLLGLLATGRNPSKYFKAYRSNRGMDWAHDVHDWLGGYPYESVLPEEVVDRLGALGFRLVRSFEKPAAAKGLFGTHCDEFVLVREA